MKRIEKVYMYGVCDNLEEVSVIWIPKKMLEEKLEKWEKWY